MKQITVICRRRENPVTAITQLLSNNGIDIRNINFQEFENDGIVNLIADDFEKTMRLLNGDNYTMVADDTLLIKVEDKLGMLAEISQRITDAGVRIRSLALLKISDEDNVVTVSTNNNDAVRKLYKGQLVN